MDTATVLSPLDGLSSTDRRRFEEFGHGPAAAIPFRSVHRAFERQARTRPDAVAAEHLREHISYGDLDRQSDLIAARLVGIGIRPGDRVGLFLRRSIPMLVGLLGILKAGATYVPQDVTVVPPNQLRHVIRTADIRVVLTMCRYADLVPDAGQVTLAVDQPVPALTPLTMPAPDDPDLGCYVLFTSGTTGMPNGVLVTHRNVANIVLTTPGNLGIGPGTRVAQLLNIGFDMASWEILACLAHGGTLVIRGADHAAAAEQADVLIATPSILAGLDPDRCHRVAVVAVAGEPCPPVLADRWAQRAVFYNGCGPTETTIVNTMHRHRRGTVLTIGRPTPNNSVYVLDADRQPVPIGEIGEMWAGGDGVSAGYLNNEALTAERYLPDPFLGGGRMMFRTRDLGRWTETGDLEHLGRTDDQVKVRGFRVELDSVSAVLETLPQVRRAVTLKHDDQTLVAFVAPDDVDPMVARHAVAEALPYYCVPAVVHALADLPQTVRGKIDKAALTRLADEFVNGVTA